MMIGAVIVCTPQDLALLDAVRGTNMFRKVDVPVSYMITCINTTCLPMYQQSYDMIISIVLNYYSFIHFI